MNNVYIGGRRVLGINVGPRWVQVYANGRDAFYEHSSYRRLVAAGFGARLVILGLKVMLS